jgi:hypothetical protein
MSLETEEIKNEDIDTDMLLANKLEKARQERESAQKEAKEQDPETTKKPEVSQNASPEDEKEYMHNELEKMGCSRAYIARMKEKHGTVVVYPHEEGKWFVVRPLRVREMKMIREIVQQDPEKLNKEILEAGCVFPKLNELSVGDLPAGLPDLLVNMISRLSAFIPVELAFSLSKEL